MKPGTLYLNNVESLPRDLQQQIVNAFGNSTSRTRKDLRLIASTTADFPGAMEEERFREDFYYLLTTLTIQLPPLSHRTEDVEPLAQYLLEQLNRNDQQQIEGFSDDVWEKFREYNWPGNVDELTAVVGEARAVCSGDIIQKSDLPFRLRSGLDAQSVGPPLQMEVTPLEELLAKVETEQIQLALEHSRHNRSQAARLLGLTRARLYRRMEALGIDEFD